MPAPYSRWMSRALPLVCLLTFSGEYPPLTGTLNKGYGQSKGTIPLVPSWEGSELGLLDWGALALRQLKDSRLLVAKFLTTPGTKIGLFHILSIQTYRSLQPTVMYL